MITLSKLAKAALVFALLSGVPALSQVQTSNSMPFPINGGARFPQLVGKNLNGALLHLPEQLPSDKTIVLFAFQKAQAGTLQSWREGLNLDDGKLAWIELPVMPLAMELIDFFTERVMRYVISDPKTRDHIVVLYADRELFCQSLGIDCDEREAYIAVIDRAGNNFITLKGQFSKEKGNQILRTLGLAHSVN
ncbi:hypothetical protein ICN48_13175 [Polynucleobacter sp. JS-Safj-400b-B2]|uniref:hypothetical protein n=1 Tax=Polynucleobacter sp. JS-Safj-400b-B2 TaxID=2576921 RepID=UPI001C0AEE5B|nr:hypothetical protein [Polynucleobacter sp. JS-Safj-400b-B2]MBU3627177.1 hypothetical protein [Polynucleobacter sp. JS-Safj-400b-B2]